MRRGPGVRFSSGASSVTSAPRMSALDPGLELAQQGGQRGQQRVQRQRTVQRPARRRQYRVPGRRALAGPGPQQRRLPDPRLAVDHDHLGGSAAGAGRDRLQAGQFVVPADRAGPGRGGPRGHGQLAAQDRGVERGRLGRGIGAQLVGQPGAGAGVGGQRPGHPAAHHVGAEQHAQGRLVVRVTFGSGRGGVGSRHPVARLEQRRRRHQPGPADQPLQLGLPELGPLAGQRLRAVAADQRERDPRGRHRAHDVACRPGASPLRG